MGIDTLADHGPESNDAELLGRHVQELADTGTHEVVIAGAVVATIGHRCRALDGLAIEVLRLCHGLVRPLALGDVRAQLDDTKQAALPVPHRMGAHPVGAPVRRRPLKLMDPSASEGGQDRTVRARAVAVVPQAIAGPASRCAEIRAGKSLCGPVGPGNLQARISVVHDAVADAVEGRELLPFETRCPLTSRCGGLCLQVAADDLQCIRGDVGPVQKVIKPHRHNSSGSLRTAGGLPAHTMHERNGDTFGLGCAGNVRAKAVLPPPPVSAGRLAE